jgi:hypothetical protein
MSVEAPKLPAGFAGLQYPITQIALAVRDLDKTMEAYYKVFGWGPWNVFDHKPPAHHNTELRGRPEHYALRGAEVYVGAATDRRSSRWHGAPAGCDRSRGMPSIERTPGSSPPGHHCRVDDLANTSVPDLSAKYRGRVPIQVAAGLDRYMKATGCTFGRGPHDSDRQGRPDHPVREGMRRVSPEHVQNGDRGREGGSHPGRTTRGLRAQRRHGPADRYYPAPPSCLRIAR